MKRTAVTALVFLSAAAIACINDTETRTRQLNPASPEHVLVGNFDRYPNALYEARIRWLLPLAKAGKLPVHQYDDLATSYDRIGDSGSALKWIEVKARLPYPAQLPFVVPGGLSAREYMAYTTEANAGTFMIHRWASEGRSKGRLSEVEAGIRRLERAVEINPNAHSGREWVQIEVAKWMVREVTSPTGRYPDFERPDAEVRAGLIGLIELGNAWESMDIFNMISLASRDDPMIAMLCYCRGRRLLGEKKPGLFGSGPVQPPGIYLEGRYKQPPLGYVRATETAWRENSRLNQFVMGKLSAGHLPDSSPLFWKGWLREKDSKVKLSWKQRNGGAEVSRQVQFALGSILLFTVAWTSVALTILLFRRLRASKQRADAPPHPRA